MRKNIPFSPYTSSSNKTPDSGDAPASNNAATGNNTPTGDKTATAETAIEETANLPNLQELSDLALHHPEQLESLRQIWIERIIQSAPPQRQARLRGLQFQIDAIRLGSKNPIHICVRLNQLLMESLYQLNAMVQSPLTESCKRTSTEYKNNPQSKNNPQTEPTHKSTSATKNSICQTAKNSHANILRFSANTSTF